MTFVSGTNRQGNSLVNRLIWSNKFSWVETEEFVRGLCDSIYERKGTKRKGKNKTSSRLILFACPAIQVDQLVGISVPLDSDSSFGRRTKKHRANERLLSLDDPDLYYDSFIRIWIYWRTKSITEKRNVCFLQQKEISSGRRSFLFVNQFHFIVCLTLPHRNI